MLRLEHLDVALAGGGQGESLRVDLRLAPGELAALEVGEGQATAVARTVVGLAEPRAGRVLVALRDVTDAPPGDRQTGYVPAGDSLLPSLSVEHNIWYGLPRHERETSRRRHRPVRAARRPAQGDRQAHDRVERLTATLDLGPTLHLRPHEIDEGQRFHAAVVRAVASLHEVLVVDLPQPVPGALPLPDILGRIRHAVPPTVTTAVLVCTTDAEALGSFDRILRPGARP